MPAKQDIRLDPPVQNRVYSVVPGGETGCWSSMRLQALASTVAAAGMVPVVLANACSHPPPPSAPDPAPTVERVDQGPTSYGSEIGGLSQEDVDAQFKSLRPELLDCVTRASDRLHCIGGNVRFRMRLDSKGAVKWVYLPESTVGDREVERCLLDRVRNRIWPKPLSGDGLAESSLDVEAGEAPSSWPRYRVALFAQKAEAATRSCRRGHRGAFHATAYVAPNGKVISAGVAPPDEKAEDASDCVVRALTSLRFAGAGGRISKVTVKLP